MDMGATIIYIKRNHTSLCHLTYIIFTAMIKEKKCQKSKVIELSASEVVMLCNDEKC